MATVRKSKGRQRIEIAKIKNESNLQVTFSKRRAGLFKKASELCTLCGAETAIIIFSPGKKIYSFGHPCIESIIDRFLARNPFLNAGALQLFQAHRSANINELNMELTEVLKEVEAEKKRGEALDKTTKAFQRQCWWAAPVEELNLEQLQVLKVSLEMLRKKVERQADKLIIEASEPPAFSVPYSVGAIPPHEPQTAGFDPQGSTFGFDGHFF
ncbi:agamous-like MADS-box protein AGL62 [Vitis riparia]|uniref:agamous-like MADS-box protein AGL62 n=1 Tax=Vitis riparia TaxID=96939 RepID=UPI00155B0A10|nr:agamous-like MADS-box protein AGL62 [Vitis riparia]